MLLSHDLAVIDVPYAREENARARVGLFVVDRPESMGFVSLPPVLKPLEFRPPLNPLLVGHWLVTETEIE